MSKLYSPFSHEIKDGQLIRRMRSDEKIQDSITPLSPTNKIPLRASFSLQIYITDLDGELWKVRDSYRKLQIKHDEMVATIKRAFDKASS